MRSNIEKMGSESPVFKSKKWFFVFIKVLNLAVANSVYEGIIHNIKILV